MITNIKFLNICFLLCILFIDSVCNYGVASNNPYGARPSAMANSSVMLGGLWSLRHNQAGITAVEKTSFGLFYENKFMINNLSFKSFCFALPFNNLAVGGDLSHYGFSSLNDIKLNVVIARKLSQYISMGISLGYNNISLGDEYGNQGTFYTACGLRVTPVKQLSLGLSIFNPGMATIPFAENYNLPTEIKVGAAYCFLTKFLISCEYSRDFDMPGQIRSGVEVSPVNDLWLRGGINFTQSYYTFGVGYGFSGIVIDMAFTDHLILGYSAHASVSFGIGSKTRATFQQPVAD